MNATATLRTRNMNKRRERLLAEARFLLANGGFEALNLRELARLADLAPLRILFWNRSDGLEDRPSYGATAPGPTRTP